ncbi:hypothetical protein AMJ80_02430 [bacterium SM23_31]|nr:MAG: hypothetical protein AMJ80_02430 [bacterium SM23_31]
MKNSKENWNQRKADLEESEADSMKRAQLLKEKNAEIVEKEKDLIEKGRALAIEKEKYENLKKLYDDLKKLSEDSEKSTKRSWPGIIDYIIWGAIGVLCFLAGKGI